MPLNTVDVLSEIEKNMKHAEELLGKGSMQPYNSANSAGRELMYTANTDQTCQLKNGQSAIVSTSYENIFGVHASSIEELDNDYRIVSKLAKFQDDPFRHYILVLLSKDGKHADIKIRKEAEHVTESYGYLYDNAILDSLSIGDSIDKGSIITKSKSYDKYNNRIDGVNLIVLFGSPNLTTDDGFIVSDVAAEKFTSPFVHVVEINLNNNDIPTNSYGTYDRYKIHPDIGEELKDGILMTYRREVKDEALYSQTWSNLMKIMPSDEKFTLNGVVADIDVFCNNPDIFDSMMHYAQIKYYYEQSMRFSKAIVDSLEPIVLDDSIEKTYKLLDLYQTHKDICEGKKWDKDGSGREFNNIKLKFTIVEMRKLLPGDKFTCRYGGKGVTAKIQKQELMPMLDNGKYVEVIANTYSVPGRKNPGQLYETAITSIGMRLLEHFKYMTTDECISEYLKFIKHNSIKEYNYTKEIISRMNQSERELYVETLLDLGDRFNGIHVSVDPISENLNLDKLDAIYKDFPYLEPYTVYVPIEDSNGNIRHVPAPKKIWVGSKFYHRLKQFAEGKFSATSLGATDLKNIPTKSNLAKTYKLRYPKTPIRFGEMETNDMLHLNVLSVIKNLMIHSSSPHARRLAEELFYENPFDVNIELNEDCSNRNVEIFYAYLKTLGLKMTFKVVNKERIQAISFQPIDFGQAKYVQVVSFENELLNQNYNFYINQETNKITPIFINPISF